MENRNCIICYDNIKQKEAVSLLCGHVYHTECVINLVRKRTRKRPLCRKRIT